MNVSEIDRKSDGPADLSFFGMENPQEGARVGDVAVGLLGSGGFEGDRSRASAELDFGAQRTDLVDRVSESGEQDRSWSPQSASGEEGAKRNEARVSESKPRFDEPIAVDSGDDEQDRSRFPEYASGEQETKRNEVRFSEPMPQIEEPIDVDSGDDEQDRSRYTVYASGEQETKRTEFTVSESKPWMEELITVDSRDEEQDRSRFPESASGEQERKRYEARISEPKPGLEESIAVDFGDEDVTSASDEIRVPHEPSWNWMHGFVTGDMVWGKVKSHPWWPGHIFNESFASPSVRRTRREGHVLVAFFGDSSYGWFDPAELIPFEPHFLEKSRQTNSRNFVKAVEEAVDEASRRGSLGLVCRCRNPYNFRPTSVPGFFAVDVMGFEPYGIYSSKQIKAARDSFDPVHALSFVNELARVPIRSEPKSVDWIRSMAMMLAYRKAVFEEFDETYAQAFGMQPVRPTQNNLAVSEQFAIRGAPLSGPLVIAEALGDKNGSTTKSAIKAAAKISSSSSSKKNKYVLKRRDEPSSNRSLPDLPPFAQHSHHYSSAPPGGGGLRNQQQSTASVLVSSSLQADNYVLQKRETAQKPIKADDGQGGRMEGSTPADNFQIGYHAPMGASDDWKPKTEPPAHTPKPGGMENIGMVDARRIIGKVEEPAIDSRDGDTFYTSPAVPLPMDFGGMPKKKKVLKRPREGIDKPDDKPDDNEEGETEKKIKKKKKKMMKYEVGGGSGYPTFKDGESHRIITARKSVGTFPDQLEGGRTLDAPPPSELDLNMLELELPHLVGDLSALALDPFFGDDRNAPSVVRHVFLKFRSLVYQKSLVLPLPSSEPDAQEARTNKLANAADTVSGPRQREPAAPTLKPFRPSMRPDDPTKAGRKRAPSDRQEEKSAKRLKKLNHLKNLSGEKKAAGSVNQKITTEGQQQQQQQRDQTKTTALSSKPSSTNSESLVKKQEPPPPPRKECRTYLVMKFPPRSTLPSIANLKARFARFGQLDIDSTRVYWKSYTCKVLFKYKSDAQAAYNYVKNNNLFGQIQVNYHLREHEDNAAPTPPESSLPSSEPAKQQWRIESQSDAGLPFRAGNGGGNATTVQLRPSSSFQQRQQYAGQLKSILKKPGDEVATAGAAGQRVKFMLASDDISRGEPQIGFAGTGNNGGDSFVVQGTQSSSSSLPPLDPVTKNSKSISFLPPPPPTLPMSTSQFLPPHPSLPSPFRGLETPQHLPPPPPMPSIPLPLQRPLPPPPPRPQPHATDGYELGGLGQFSEAQSRHHVQHYGEMELGRNNNKSNVDISHQMFSLLLRCNDIVTCLKSSPGYVPYRPL